MGKDKVCPLRDWTSYGHDCIILWWLQKFNHKSTLMVSYFIFSIASGVNSLSGKYWIGLVVVATTRQNGTCSLLTSAKLLTGYLVVGITRELDKELLLHCSSIYINTKWSVLQQCVYLMSYYSSTMPYPCALMSYSLISVTMYILCIHHEEPLSLDVISNPNSF